MLLFSLFACLAPGLGGDETDGVSDAALDADAFATMASKDISEMASNAASVASLADAARLDPATADRCEPTWGDCVACLTVTPAGDGTGTFLIEPEATPCGASWTSRRDVTYTCSLTSSVYDGTYAPFEQGRRIAMSGARSLSMTTEGGADGDRSWSASLALTELLLDTDGAGSMASFVLGLTYDGFGDRTWTLTAEGSPGVVVGTATNGDRSCAVSGAPSAPVIDCD